MHDAAHIRPTKAAEARINHLLDQEAPWSFLRVSVLSGGCAGFTKSFTIGNVRAGDLESTDHVVFGSDGRLLIVVDEYSDSLLGTGSELDFHEALDGDRFVITNPAQRSQCGCGKSFSV